MEKMKTVGITLAILISSVVGAAPAYYFGDVNYFSMDGSHSMGKTVSLVRRVIDADKGEISEYVTQPSSNEKGSGADEYQTIMKLDSEGKFIVSEPNKSFSGQIIFFGKPWEWSAWDYDIALTNGGRITGSGSLSSAGILTNKSLRQGNFEMKIIENLAPISEGEYLTIRQNLLGK